MDLSFSVDFIFIEVMYNLMLVYNSCLHVIIVKYELKEDRILCKKYNIDICYELFLLLPLQFFVRKWNLFLMPSWRTGVGADSMTGTYIVTVASTYTYEVYGFWSVLLLYFIMTQRLGYPKIIPHFERKSS